jgi:hypothetical protein
VYRQAARPVPRISFKRNDYYFFVERAQRLEEHGLRSGPFFRLLCCLAASLRDLFFIFFKLF